MRLWSDGLSTVNSGSRDPVGNFPKAFTLAGTINTAKALGAGMLRGPSGLNDEARFTRIERVRSRPSEPRRGCSSSRVSMGHEMGHGATQTSAESDTAKAA